MRISILDPYLRMLDGHFTDLDLRLAMLWTQLGHKVVVHCRKDAPPSLDPLFGDAGIGFVRSFSIPEPAWSEPGFNPFERLRLTSAAYAQDLQSAEEAELVFWPSASSACALAQAMSGSTVPVVFGIFEHPGAISPASPGAFAASSQLMRQRGMTVVFGHYVEDFAPIWSSILGPETIKPLPYPTAGRPEPRPLSAPLRIGLTGALRPERGSRIAIPLIERLLAEGFSVILQDSRGEVPAFTHPRLERYGFLRDITPVVAACDLMLWPSSASQYLSRPSGIVAEAIACAVPVVMTSACYPAEMAVKQGAAIFFHRIDLEEIAATVKQAAARIVSLKQDAWACSLRWQARHGVEKLAQRVLELGSSA